MKIVSWNLNGIRAAAKGGFFDWLKNCDADLVLLQEVRAERDQLSSEWLTPFGYKSYFFPAQKKGYSGVGIYVREKIGEHQIHLGLGDVAFDSEGRVISIRIGKLIVMSCYFPNTQRLGARLEYKLAFCNYLQKQVEGHVKEGYSVVVGGDYNIAHTELDLANPKQNEKNAGFLPEERQWVTDFIKSGFIDTFRMFEKKGGHYTWWKNFPADIRARNIGWRIDYHFVSKNLIDHVCNAEILSNVMGSDHCPVTLELKNL